MTLDDVRQVINAEIVVAVDGFTEEIFPVDWQNRFNLDTAAQDKVYVAQEIIWGPGIQKSMGRPAIVRYESTLAMSVHTKEGDGIALATRFVDHLLNHFRLQAFFKAGDQQAAHFKAGQPLPAADVKGWHVLPLNLPFYFDEIVA